MLKFEPTLCSEDLAVGRHILHTGQRVQACVRPHRPAWESNPAQRPGEVCRIQQTAALGSLGRSPDPSPPASWGLSSPPELGVASVCLWAAGHITSLVALPLWSKP